MNYRIEINRIAELTLQGKFAFDGYDPNGVYPYAMFVYLLRGPGLKPFLVDTGPRSIEEINKGLSGLVVEPVTQRPDEDMPSILAKADVKPEDISHVFFTHLHYDHVSNVHMFPNAKIVVSRPGFEEAVRRQGGPAPGEVYFPMLQEWKDRVMLVEDGQEVLPGIRPLLLGGHTPCSMGLSVPTSQGKAVITGDVVSLYANIEMDIPIGVYEDVDLIRAGMQRIREEADIVIPSHDPAVFERFPDGVIE